MEITCGKHEDAIIWADKALSIDSNNGNLLYIKGIKIKNLIH